MTFSSDSQYLAYGGRDHRIEVADVESGARVHVFPTPDEVLALAFHPTTLLLAYTTADKKNVGEVHIVAGVQQAPAPTPAPAATGAHAASSSHKFARHGAPPPAAKGAQIKQEPKSAAAVAAAHEARARAERERKQFGMAQQQQQPTAKPTHTTTSTAAAMEE